MIPASAAKKLVDNIQKAGGADLLPLEENLVDLVWANERPPRPQEPVIVLPEKFNGKTVQAKLEELREELQKKHAAGFVVSMLDEIAWLFNLRGSDIPFNPVFFSYAVVTHELATLYVDESKLGEAVKAHLSASGVQIRPYNAILDDARSLKEQTEGLKESSNRLLLSNRGSWALQRALGGEKLVDVVRSPIGDAKAIKNETELEGMRACHVRDGAALIQYFAWLEDQLVAKRAVLDEVQADDKLIEFRSKQTDFVGLSFPTISSTGAK